MSARIVVIDDEPAVADLLGKVLERAGHSVRVAHTGEAGLEALAASQTDCLVVDRMLPQMGGLEVVAEARGRWPALAIVMVTARPEPFSLDAPRPDVVLLKPFRDLEAIEDAVREALEAVASRGPLDELRQRVAAVVAEITPGRRRRD